MYRSLVIGSLLLWVAAMSCLFMRDVYPAWTAQDAPPVTPAMLNNLQALQEQYGIFRGDGARLGTAWSNIAMSGGNTTVHGTAALAPAMLPEVRIETITEFTPDGALDSFSLDVYGVPMTVIKVRGERRGPYFPCELQVGPLIRQANLELSASRMIGDTLRPFSYLPTLKVGQSWRMQLLDPVAAVMARRTQFTSIVARVTGEETIQHDGRPVICKVVETSPQQVKAWVAPDGRVLVQEAEMPGLGKVRVEQERYNNVARSEVKERIRSGNLRRGEQE